MLEIVLIVGVTLALVLYGQARHAAREIRRNRSECYVASADTLPPLTQDR